MKFGAHVSIARGLHLAFERAQELGLESLQIFSRNQSQWKAKPLTQEAIELWLTAWNEYGRSTPVVVHASYLINLASPRDLLWQRSCSGLRLELERCESLAIPFLVLHPGAHVGSGEEAGIRRVTRALDRVHEELPDYKVRTLLEGTAGQGTVLGARFDHLAKILSDVSAPQRLGICLDTAHLHAAGHDLRTPEAYARTLNEFDEQVGFDTLEVVHVNDSSREFGSHVDRHANLGEGTLGLDAFRQLLSDQRMKELPFILETPMENGGHGRDLATLRSLLSP